MKVTIDTPIFKAVLNKASRGIGNNKLKPITQKMLIELKNGTLIVLTTDATNFFYVKQHNITGDDFSVVVNADKFSKLISKMSCDKITLDITENAVKVSGNGTYNIEIEIDETTGKFIKYPNPITSIDISDDVLIGELSINTIKNVMAEIKSAVAPADTSIYSSYYFGESIVGTDISKIATIDECVFDKPILISSEVMNLLSVVTDTLISVYEVDNKLIFASDNYIIFSSILDTADKFQFDKINEFIKMDFTYSCKISKNELLNLLDRLSLFVGPYDKNEINMQFNKMGIRISSKDTYAEEYIAYTDNMTADDFDCVIDVETFKGQVKVADCDIIELHFGNESAIKIIDKTAVQLIALNSK